VRQAYGRLSTSFEPNVGQADPSVAFVTQGGGSRIGLAPTEVVFPSSATGAVPGAPAAVRMRLKGADPNAPLSGQDRLAGVVNYLSPDPAAARTGVPTYARVTARQAWPGIDAVYHGGQGRFEYDFVVAPGADPGQIGLEFPDATGLALDPGGDLLIQTATGQLRQEAPRLYQTRGGHRHAVTGHFVRSGADAVGFSVGPYDHSRPLVIDPSIVYATYLGGSGSDTPGRMALDPSGDAYVAGQTTSTDFPVTAGAFRTTLPPDFGGVAGFVTKLNPQGTGLVYSTYFPGLPTGLGVDSGGNAYLAVVPGNLPTTPGAFDASPDSGAVVKLSPTGSLLYATYFPGDFGSFGVSLAVGSGGDVYVAAPATAGFSPTPGSFRTAPSTPMPWLIARLHPGGHGAADLVYATYFPAEVDDIAVTGTGRIYAAGFGSVGYLPTTPGSFDPVCSNCGGAGIYVSILDPSRPGAAALIYSTFVGVGGVDAIALGPTGDAYVVGTTNARPPRLPTTPNAFMPTHDPCIFVCGYAFRLRPASQGAADLVYSTFLAGQSGTGQVATEPRDVVVDSTGSAWVTGGTSSPDFPLAAPLRPCPGAFLTRFDPSGSRLLFSTCLGGGAGTGIARDGLGNIYVAGAVNDNTLLVTPGAFRTRYQGGGSDGFVVKLRP
jgi:sugar lactone lactonase YvrE